MLLKIVFDTNESIKKIKSMYPNLRVQVDGGVTLENASLLKHAGVDRLVVGNALFESGDIMHTLNQFKKI